MVIVDTSALLAYLDSAEPDHRRVASALKKVSGAFIVSELVLAELDYLVLTRYGVRSELAILDAMRHSRWRIVALGSDGLADARSIIADYADEKIGLTDAANLVLAKRFHAAQIATLDRRHFSVVRLHDGKYPILIP